MSYSDIVSDGGLDPRSKGDGMTTQHTPGRLKVRGFINLRTEAGNHPIASCNPQGLDHADEANARRLVACWNRLEKFTTEQIEDFGYDLFADVRPDFDRAMRERDKLQLLCAEWEKKAATWLASPEAAQRLDGYRDLAQQLNTATAQRDELLAVLRGVQKRCAPSGFVGMDGQYLKEVGAAIAKAEGDAK